MRIYMQTPFQEDQPPRFYHLFLQEDMLAGWNVVREWGFQGSPGRLLREHFAERDAAQQALLRHRDAQLRRGYRVMFVQGQEYTS